MLHANLVLVAIFNPERLHVSTSMRFRGATHLLGMGVLLVLMPWRVVPVDEVSLRGRDRLC